VVFPQTKLLYVLSPCKLTKNLVRLFDLEKSDLAELKQKYDELSTKHKQCVLRIEHVIASDTNFKFYTSFPNYTTFKVLFDYLQPAF
jgi:hypothetical protein